MSQEQAAGSHVEFLGWMSQTLNTAGHGVGMALHRPWQGCSKAWWVLAVCRVEDELHLKEKLGGKGSVTAEGLFAHFNE